MSIICKSVVGGWQTEVKETNQLFGPIFNNINDLWVWQKSRKEVDFICHTDGEGYWSEDQSAVRIIRLALSYVSDDHQFGELLVYFDTDTWDTSSQGLIYTDELFITQLKARLHELGYDVSDIGYSEQGMQGVDYVSLDVGGSFLLTF